MFGIRTFAGACAALGFIGLAAAAPAAAQQAASQPNLAQPNLMKECGGEYQTAKAANQLGGKSWNEYLSECRARHAQGKPAAEPAKAEPAKAEAAKSAAPAAPSGPAVFPAKVDPKYSTLKPGQQRMKTCADQYDANKAGNANGGLKFIQKGGGYWSQCNTRLKS